MANHLNLTEKFIAFNESILSVVDFNYTYSDSDKVIYEVIRVINSTPIFLELHLDRLFNSIKLMGLYAPERGVITRKITELLKANPVAENNIRISLVYNSNSKPDLLIYFIPSTYPTESQKTNGIKIKFLNANRDNPNAKIENINLRANANAIIKETGCYDVLLINKDGYITEGSRSNVIFIKNNYLISAPLKMILNGVTRQVVVNAAKEIGIQVKEELITADEISSFDGAILTGTSPGILPIASIDNHIYRVELPLIISLTKQYYNAVARDISNFKVS
ncbi:MAG: aminotransferase class IV [Bacteroidales bacterium]|nr:aminotransferase class IV [Bacteroidales bacterium]